MNESEIKFFATKFLENIKRLSDYDEKKLKYASLLKQASTETEVASCCIDLKDYTDQSTEQLKKISESLMEIVLLDRSNSDDENTLKLLLLVEIYQKLIKNMISFREKELRRISYLVKFLNHLDKPLVNLYYNHVKKKFFNLIEKENEIIKKMISYYQYDKEIIKILLKMEKVEKIKGIVTTTVVGAVWLTPGFGSVIAGIIFHIFNYANQFTRNYQQLQVYSK